MKKLMLFVLIMFAGTLSQASPLDQGKEYIVTAHSGLNMRAQPNLESKIVYYLEFGDKVRIMEVLTDHELTLEWVEGSWAKVSFEGIEGYVFDGYLSNLPLPTNESEFSVMHLDLVYPLEAWVDLNLLNGSQIDTLINRTSEYKTVQNLLNNQRIVKTQSTGLYKVELYLENTRLMDVYHLLYAMLPSKAEKSEFSQGSLFIDGQSGKLSTIKIQVDNPVEIKKLKNGQIRVSVYSYYDGC